MDISLLIRCRHLHPQDKDKIIYPDAKVTRLTDLGYQDRPRKHVFYRYRGNILGQPVTILWAVDEPQLKVGAYFLYFRECDGFFISNRFRPLLFLKYEDSREGEVDSVDEDGTLHIFPLD